MTSRPLLITLVVGLYGSNALAQIETAQPTAIVLPTTLPVVVQGGAPATHCTAIYSNMSTPASAYLPQPSGVFIGDDLHVQMPAADHLVPGCAIEIGYYKPSPGAMSADISLMYSDTNDGRPTTVMGGYHADNLPSGANVLHLDGTAFYTGAGSFWVIVKFGEPGAGLLLANPPTVGTSQDLAYDGGLNDFNFGGAPAYPAANFMMAVYADVSSPVRPATWGELKTTYR
jgi:hypothetical protein